MKDKKLLSNLVIDDQPLLRDIPVSNIIDDWIQNHTNDIISLWDDCGKLLFITNAVQKVFGYHSSNIINWSWRKFLNKQDADTIYKNMIDQKNRAQQIEFQIAHKDGHYVWCQVTIIKHQNPQTNNDYYVSIIQDISAEKEVERLITYSEKMSIAGQLATGIVHEIRNPLTSLKGFLQLLQSGVEEKGVYYDIMVEEIKKIEAITSELLYISKPISNNVQKEENVSSMLIEVIELLRPEAKFKNIHLEIDIETDESIIMCNRSEIKQVFINVIKNAIEAMDNEGIIHINVSDINNELWIDIIDEGVGILPEQAHRLEEAFFTTKETGTGLGLVISKKIITRHHGKLTYFRNKGKGSTFRIIFPIDND